MLNGKQPTVKSPKNAPKTAEIAQNTPEKRVIILLNGEGYNGEIDGENAVVLCADGAYRWAKRKIKIDENLGDFDSLDETPFPPPKEIYPTQKDCTDGEIALEKALALVEAGKASRIEIYGGGGGREDHFLGNLHLLYRAQKSGVFCVMKTNYADIFVAEGKIVLENVKGKTVSLFPFGGDAHIMDSAGLFYAAEDLTLPYGVCRGVSNVATADRAEIFCDKGVLLVFVNHGGV